MTAKAVPHSLRRSLEEGRDTSKLVDRLRMELAVLESCGEQVVRLLWPRFDFVPNTFSVVMVRPPAAACAAGVGGS